MGECHHDVRIIDESQDPDREPKRYDWQLQRIVEVPPLPPFLRLANDEDWYYYEEFHSRAEAEAFIRRFTAAMDACWPPHTPEGS